MGSNLDLLYRIFERHLLDPTSKEKEQDEFIFRIVEEYVMNLIREAHIPIHYLETIRQDLEAEVLEMFRVKTYGHPNLKSYFTK